MNRITLHQQNQKAFYKKKRLFALLRSILFFTFLQNLWDQYWHNKQLKKFRSLKAKWKLHRHQKKRKLKRQKMMTQLDSLNTEIVFHKNFIVSQERNTPSEVLQASKPRTQLPQPSRPSL